MPSLPERTASLHITEIKSDSQTHYHKKMTEYYYVLEGEGTMELDGESLPIRPGSAVMIRPGCRHRAVGRLKVLIVPVPAFIAGYALVWIAFSTAAALLQMMLGRAMMLTPGMSIPRAAISVATRIGTSPERNTPNARSRCAWLLLP